MPFGDSEMGSSEGVGGHNLTDVAEDVLCYDSGDCHVVKIQLFGESLGVLDGIALQHLMKNDPV